MENVLFQLESGHLIIQGHLEYSLFRMIKYSKKKTEDAVMKVEKVIKDLIKGQKMINFNIVCTKSGVSKSFLECVNVKELIWLKKKGKFKGR